MFWQWGLPRSIERLMFWQIQIQLNWVLEALGYICFPTAVHQSCNKQMGSAVHICRKCTYSAHETQEPNACGPVMGCEPSGGAEPGEAICQIAQCSHSETSPFWNILSPNTTLYPIAKLHKLLLPTVLYFVKSYISAISKTHFEEEGSS